MMIKKIKTFYWNFLDELTTYDSGGQSQPNSDHEGVQRLIAKTSLTPNDSQKVVIEVTTTDSDTTKGIFSFFVLISKIKYFIKK